MVQLLPPSRLQDPGTDEEVIDSDMMTSNYNNPITSAIEITHKKRQQMEKEEEEKKMGVEGHFNLPAREARMMWEAFLQSNSVSHLVVWVPPSLFDMVSGGTSASWKKPFCPS